MTWLIKGGRFDPFPGGKGLATLVLALIALSVRHDALSPLVVCSIVRMPMFTHLIYLPADFPLAF